MSYEVKLMRPDTSVMMNGLSKGGVMVEILTIPAGQSGSKVYPRTSVDGLYYFSARAAEHALSIDAAPNGSGRLNWTATGGASRGASIVYVFSKKLLSQDQYGIILHNDVDEVLADHGYPAPQFVGTINLATAPQSARNTPDGYVAYTHVSGSFDLQSGSDKMVTLAMPDSGTDDTWYSLRTESIPANAGNVNVTLVVYTKASTYKLPTLHIYAVNNPVPSSDPIVFRVYGADTLLTFDGMSECVSIKDALTVAYPAPGSTSTYSLGFTTLPAITIPYVMKSQTSNATGPYIETRWYSAAKRVGSQLTLQLLKDSLFQDPYGANGGYVLGDLNNRYLPVIDATALGAGTSNGEGGPATGAPVITTQPANQTVQAGSTASFSIAATGATSYQWYYNNALVSGATGTSYSRAMASGDDGALVYCVVSNANGSTKSNNVTVTVITNSGGVAASITSYTHSMTVTSGNTVTLNMNASGTPTPSCSISGPAGSASGSGNASLSFTALQANAGTYTFSASNSGGSDSVTMVLTVQDTPPQPAVPVISQQPQSKTVAQNSSASLTCVASPATSYQWYKDGAYFGSGGTISIDTSTVGSATYYCLVYNDTSYVKSSDAYVTVQAPGDMPFTNYRDISRNKTVTDTNVELAVTRDGDVYIDGSYSGSWAASGSSSGTMYTAQGSGNFPPAVGSFAFGVEYSFASYGGVSFISPEPRYDGVTRSYSMGVTVYLNGSPVSSISLSITCFSTDTGGVPIN